MSSVKSLFRETWCWWRKKMSVMTRRIRDWLSFKPTRSWETRGMIVFSVKRYLNRWRNWTTSHSPMETWLRSRGKLSMICRSMSSCRISEKSKIRRKRERSCRQDLMLKQMSWCFSHSKESNSKRHCRRAILNLLREWETSRMIKL